MAPVPVRLPTCLLHCYDITASYSVQAAGALSSISLPSLICIHNFTVDNCLLTGYVIPAAERPTKARLVNRTVDTDVSWRIYILLILNKLSTDSCQITPWALDTQRKLTLSD